jgi:hypothetical protein
MKRTVLFGFFILCLLVTDCGTQLEVGIFYPLDESVVNGIVSVTAEIRNVPVVTNVEFYIDDSLVKTDRNEPYTYIWNTFVLDDYTTHELYVIAHERDVEVDTSETVNVTINNGAVLFADDFEIYDDDVYPGAGGWYQIWTGESPSTVIRGIAYNGNMCFKLHGGDEYPSTDGVGLDMSNTIRLSYEFSVMIPNQSTGGLVGFFRLVNPQLGEIFNGVMFDYTHTIHVRGVDPYDTGRAWQTETWYSVRVELDFESNTMDVWVDDQIIAENVESASRDTSYVFAVATETGSGGIVYYDDIMIDEE